MPQKHDARVGIGIVWGEGGALYLKINNNFQLCKLLQMNHHELKIENVYFMFLKVLIPCPRSSRPDKTDLGLSGTRRFYTFHFLRICDFQE